jgi:hypothetical protein
MSFVKTDLNSSAQSTLEKSARPEYPNWPDVNLRPITTRIRSCQQFSSFSR